MALSKLIKTYVHQTVLTTTNKHRMYLGSHRMSDAIYKSLMTDFKKLLDNDLICNESCHIEVSDFNGVVLLEFTFQLTELGRDLLKFERL